MTKILIQFFLDVPRPPSSIWPRCDRFRCALSAWPPISWKRSPHSPRTLVPPSPDALRSFPLSSTEHVIDVDTFLIKSRGRSLLEDNTCTHRKRTVVITDMCLYLTLSRAEVLARGTSRPIREVALRHGGRFTSGNPIPQDGYLPTNGNNRPQANKYPTGPEYPYGHTHSVWSAGPRPVLKHSLRASKQLRQHINPLFRSP